MKVYHWKLTSNWITGRVISYWTHVKKVVDLPLVLNTTSISVLKRNIFSNLEAEKKAKRKKKL